jgi:hypothetical protein
MKRTVVRVAWNIGVSLAIAVAGAARAAETPGTVVQWKPIPIASPEYESHPAFDPKTGELYFVRSSPKFEGGAFS